MSEPSFWKDHLRHSVEFLDAAESISDRKNIIFIECGTGKQLASFIRRIYSDRTDKFVISLIEEEIFPEYGQFITSVGRIWQAGIDVDRNITDDTDYAHAETNYLPTYHFIGKEFMHNVVCIT
jgi:acyl transferase domain-containing protein